MTFAEKDAFIQKELKLVEVYLDNMRKLGSWRLWAILALSLDARGSLRKTMGLMGHTGQWWRDALLYVDTCLLLIFPFDLLAYFSAAYAALVAALSGLFSFVTMEPRVITESVTVPVWFFFKTTKTITKTIMVPVFHAPHWSISQGAAVLIALSGLYLVSWVLKRLWTWQIDFRRRHIAQRWETISANDRNG